VLRKIFSWEGASKKIKYLKLWTTLIFLNDYYLAIECLDKESLLPWGDGLSKSTGEDIEETALKCKSITNITFYCSRNIPIVTAISHTSSWTSGQVCVGCTLEFHRKCWSSFENPTLIITIGPMAHIFHWRSSSFIYFSCICHKSIKSSRYFILPPLLRKIFIWKKRLEI